jgi:LysM repeat protein
MNYPPIILMAALAVALLYHLSQFAGPRRLLHAAYAATAAGLIYILGSGAFGWRAGAEPALLWAYVGLFALVGAYAARRRAQFGAIGLPWLSALVQQGVMAYMFAPDSFRKPPVTFLLLIYFALEVVVWLRGREEEPDAPAVADLESRPPLFPPKRRRGLTEVALAAVSAAIVYLLFVGPRGPVVAPEAATTEQAADSQIEQTAASEESAPAQEPVAEAKPAETEAKQAEAEAKTPDSAPKIAATELDASAGAQSAAAKASQAYAARAGDTFKSIAKRIYGTPEKWRAIADVNPDVKSKKLRAGQLIKLPSPPTR